MSTSAEGIVHTEKKTFLSAQVSVATVKQKKKKKNKDKVYISKSTSRYYFQDVFHFKALFEEVLETLFLSCTVLQKIFLEKCLINSRWKVRSCLLNILLTKPLIKPYKLLHCTQQSRISRYNSKLWNYQDALQLYLDFFLNPWRNGIFTGYPCFLSVLWVWDLQKIKFYQ